MYRTWQEIIQNEPGLNDLLYNKKIASSIWKLIGAKNLSNVEFDPNTLMIKNYSGCDGLTFKLIVTSNADENYILEFRFFFDPFIFPDNFQRLDASAGIAKKNLPLATRIELRILRKIFEEVKLFSDDEFARTHSSRKKHKVIIWTSNTDCFDRASSNN